MIKDEAQESVVSKRFACGKKTIDAHVMAVTCQVAEFLQRKSWSTSAKKPRSETDGVKSGRVSESQLAVCESLSLSDPKQCETVRNVVIEHWPLERKLFW